MNEWRVEFEGHAWSSADLTAGDAAVVCLLAGDQWAALDPLSSPNALMANVAALLSTRGGVPADEAVAYVALQPLADLMGCVKVSQPGA